MSKRHPTSINYLKLPIFSGTKNSEIPDTYKFEYTDKKEKFEIEIRNGKLSPFHRKLFLCLEVLYIKQNPDFKRNFVRTSFKDITNTLGLKGNPHRYIIDSLEDLQRVNIKSVIRTKKEENIETEEGVLFNLLPKVKWKLTRSLDERNKENLRKYTSYIDIYFEDFHIQNLKQKYYRLINFELIKIFKPKTIRFFDYLNLNCYYNDNGIWKQKQSIRIYYDELVKYLLLKKHRKKSYRERQLQGQLEELKEKGVIKYYKFEHDLFDETSVYLKLSPSINLWSKYTVNDTEIDKIDKLSPLQQCLKERWISIKQIKYITDNFKENYIKDKIEQVDYISKSLPHKVRGIGSYLYNSIKYDWKDDGFEEYRENKNQIELNLFTTKQKEKEHQYTNEYEEDCNRICVDYWKRMIDEEKIPILNSIEEKISKNNFVKVNKSIEKLYRETLKIELIKESIQMPKYEEWIKKRKENN